MKRLFFVLFSSFFLLLSCAKQKPSGILSESKITDLFTETALIDAYLNTLPADSGRKVMLVLYDNLFNDFNIDSNQFKQNLDYYYGNPKLTEQIYINVDKRLKEYDQTFRVKDSIRNVIVQDSIRHISNLQDAHNERINLTLHFTKDSTTYDYKDCGADFLSKAHLNLNAYGIQIPAIISPVQEPTDEVVKDSIATELEMRPEELIDTATIDTARKIVKKEVLSSPVPKKQQIQRNR